MRARGALHVHSTLSRDGTMTIAELAHWYAAKGYQFLAMGEHAEDLNEATVEVLRQQSADHSTPQFCVIPGMEFSCSGGIHIHGIGATRLVAEKEPLAVIHEIHAQGGLAILAHPKRIRWKCPRAILLAVDGAEIWNVGYDGKYLLSPQALGGFRRMQEANPELLAVASHDFHRTASFYDVAIEMDVARLTREAFLRNLRAGRYEIRGQFFRTDPRARFSWVETVWFWLLGWQLSTLRKARSFLFQGSP